MGKNEAANVIWGQMVKGLERFAIKLDFVLWEMGSHGRSLRAWLYLRKISLPQYGGDPSGG